MEEENILQASLDKGDQARARMATWLEDYNFVGDVRGLGLSIGIEIVKDPDQKEKDAQAALKITNRCYEKGVLIITLAGNVLRFQPPLNISQEDLDQALTIIEESLADYQAGLLDGYDVSGQGWS